MATRTFADLAPYQAQALQPAQDPLSSLIQGFQLPQQIQDQALTRQLNNLILQQKISDLQNPDAALAREIRSKLAVQGALNPDTGYYTAPAGLAGETIQNPGALTGAQQAALGSPLPSVLPAPTFVQPTAQAGLPDRTIAINGVQTGINQNLNTVIKAANDAALQKQQGLQAASDIIQNRQIAVDAAKEQAKLGVVEKPIVTSPGQKVVNSKGVIIFENPAAEKVDKNITLKSTDYPVTILHPDGTKDIIQSPDLGPNTLTPDHSIERDVQAILEGRNTAYNIRQTMGRSNKSAEYMQKIRNGITDIDPNFDFVASDAGGKSVSTPFVQKSTVAINAVLPNIDKFIQLSNEVPRLGVAGVDKLLQSGAVQFGNKKVSNLKEAQRLIGDELGLALGNGNVSDMKLQLGLDLTDPSVTQEVFSSNLGIAKEFLNNRLTAIQGLRTKSATVNPTATQNTFVTPEIQKSIDSASHFSSEEAARKAGKNSGDIIILNGRPARLK